MTNFDTAFTSGRDDWETPDELFIPLDIEFGFSTDVCASENNTKCSHFYSIENNALEKHWNGVCWMNPPFGQKAKWVKKAYQESLLGATVVCLLPARTNTNWWHDYCMRGEIRYIRGRVKFKGASHGLPQPLAVVVFRGR